MKQIAWLWTPGASGRRWIAGVWAACLLVTTQVLPPPVLPRPTDVVLAEVRLIQDGVLLPALVSSFTLNMEAVAISTAVSLLLAYGSLLPVLRPLASATATLRYLGFTGLTFAFMLVLSGHSLKLALLVLGMSTFFTTSMLGVLRDIPQSAYDHAQTLRMGPWRRMFEVAVLGTLDKVFENVAVNGAIGWILLTTVEGLVRSEGGLGVLLLNENRGFRLDTVYAIQCTVFAVALACDFGVRALGRLFCPYADIGKTRE